VLHRVKKEPPRSCRRPCPNPPSRALVSSSEQNARTSLDSLRRREMGVAVHHGVQTTPSQSWAWSPESELHLTVSSPGRGQDTQVRDFCCLDLSEKAKDRCSST
jgi:hypothetical protein